MSANNHRYDIVIIGTGAGGGTLAYALASIGKRILLPEPVKCPAKRVPHRGSTSPAWPISYERGTDTTEPPSSALYGYPAMNHELRICPGELTRALRE
jgi:glycine/D-amino acid oxidase-like deaminating enzyme